MGNIEGNILRIETVLGEVEIHLPDPEPLNPDEQYLETDEVLDEETGKTEIVMLHFRNYGTE